VAKGNDGHLLQHGIECELGKRLFDVGGQQGLHLIVTHGMAPTEPFEPREANPGAFVKLERWLDYARQQIPPNDSPSVLSAYRSCGASTAAYPNTGELLAAIIERDKLRGHITEIEPSKIASLDQKWRSMGIKILPGSWRDFLYEYRCPDRLDTPWLFTMDPMTYTKKPFEDDNQLRKCDLRFLLPVFRSYFASSQPGAVCVFCFSLQPNPRLIFINDVQTELAQKLPGVCAYFFETTARGGNKHVGAVLSQDKAMMQEVDAAWRFLSVQSRS